jgi:hypothetical protein
MTCQSQLQDGQRCASFTYRTIEVKAQASLDMMPGVVSLPHGWGMRAGAQMHCQRPAG